MAHIPYTLNVLSNVGFLVGRALRADLHSTLVGWERVATLHSPPASC